MEHRRARLQADAAGIAAGASVLTSAAIALSIARAWRLASLRAIVDALRALPLRAPKSVVIDGSRLEALDTAAGFMLLRHLADIGCTASMVTPRGFEPRHARLLGLVTTA
jgi:hypothetical protein